MAVIVGSPGGVAQFPFNFVGGAEWDPGSVVNLSFYDNIDANGNVIPGSNPNLDANGKPINLEVQQHLYLGAGSGSGKNQGVCISPSFGQSITRNPTGSFYWEITWIDLDNPTMLGGIGVIANPGSNNTFAQLVTPLAVQFGQLAADGTGGCIIRPNGDVWAGGQMLASGDFTLLAQIKGDTIGVLLTLNNGGQTTVNFLGCNGAIKNIIWSLAALPAASYVPVVVFGSNATGENLTLANFGVFGDAGFLGPKVFGTGSGDEFDPANGITLGWPNDL